MNASASPTSSVLTVPASPAPRSPDAAVRPSGDPESVRGFNPGSRPVIVTQVLFGLVFLGSGIMGLTGSTPPSTSAASAAFIGALEATGYFIPLLSAVQIVAGVLLISGRAVPAALVALAPVVVHILAFRIFLTPVRLLPSALVLVGAETALAWAYRGRLLPLFRPAA